MDMDMDTDVGVEVVNLDVLDEDAIKGYLQGLIDDADNDERVEHANKAREYYDAHPWPAEAGRSKVMDTSVRDSVEWILPSIIDSLSGNVVRFSPMSPNDEQQADLETEFTRYVFSQENNGFLNLHNFAKDALLNRVAFFKVFYDDTPERVVERYDGLSEPQLEMLLADEMVEVTQIDRDETGIAVRVARVVRQGRVRVEVVPVERVRINKDHDSLDLSEARIVVHSERRSASDLLAQGYDPEKIENASEDFLTGDTEYVGSVSDDPSQKQLVVSEAYCRMDINNDGISELVKIVFLGETDVDEILDLEEVDEIPFFAGSAIPMPHQVDGVSVFDLLKQTQDSKTAVLRSTHDNFYLANNRQKVVITDLVNLNDLKVSRPGGVIRAKGPGAITELGGQAIAGDALTFLQYLDQQRTDRIGISGDTAGQNQMVGNESAHGIERVMSAKEMKVGLMVRSLAETGLKPVYKRIRDLMVRYHKGSVPLKFKDSWVNVDPSVWGERSRMAVTVGTGAGTELQKQNALLYVMQAQEKLMAAGSPLVGPANIYSALEDYVELSGIESVSSYFVNPSTPEGQQAMQQKQQGDQQAQQQQMEVQKAQLQAQSTLVQAEMTKAQADIQANQVRVQTEALKLQHAQEVEALKAQLKAAQEMADYKFNLSKLQADTAIRLTELEVQAKDKALEREYQSNLVSIKGNPDVRGAGDSAKRSQEGQGGGNDSPDPRDIPATANQ